MTQTVESGRTRQATGRHRATASMVQPPPTEAEKYVYIQRALPYLAVAVSISFVAATSSQVLFEISSRIWPFAFFTFFGLIAFGLSMPLSFTGRGFALGPHKTLVEAWRPARYPSVDIYLPICGEPIDVLANTWKAVSKLIESYPGIAIPYVLDDGASSEAEALAARMGIPYVVRPNRGEHMKSGNLRHAFAHTRGEFFVILDADFAPRPDFLAESLPYFDDPSVAIVQTPQYFRAARDQTWVEQAAGAVQEVFYRAIQVARDRLGASICVGSCAVYRRTALEPQGGTTLIAYAEDVHTGLDVRRQGWKLRYIPVVLSTGRCPEGLSAFVRQQYRWCTGSTSTVLSTRLWTVPMGIRSRMTYLSGFAYYIFTGLSVFAVPIIPITLLALRPWSITPLNSGLIVVSMLTSMTVLPLWHLSSYDLRAVFPLALARGWAHALAIWDYLRGKTMAWQATGAGVSTVRRFQWGTRLWSGGAAAVWLVLAGLRISEMGVGRFSIVAIGAVVNFATVMRVIFPGKDAK